jgi:cytochrome bd-type quinol oxidase subunit 2
MYYRWVLFLHIASVFVFLAAHGVSIVVLYRIRGERDRRRILDLITLSGETTIPMYVALAAIVVTGVLAGLKAQWFRYAWIWVAIVLLIVIVGLMTAIAKPYFNRVKAACEVRPSGVPRVSDQELGEILAAPTVGAISAIGIVGLLAILYLMVFKPWVG